MKLLMFGANSFAWQPFSKTLEEVQDVDQGHQVTQAVVVFFHAEEQDPENAKVETKMVKNIKWLAKKLDLNHIVLHSFTHLSTSTAPAAYAQDLIQNVSKRLTDVDYHVCHTPFGYMSSWDLSVMGESLGKVFKEF